jgi:hypothetical protein
VNPVTTPSLISTDIDFGTIEYGDPFPDTWPRVFSFCQQAALAMPSLTTTETLFYGTGGTETETITWNYNLTNRQSIALPSAPVTPMISPVLNPTINGATLFTEATLNTRALSLNWNKPAIGSPFGYSVQVINLPVANGLLGLTSAVVTLRTAQTSMIVPPELLTAGQTYLISITALMDGKANMETSPNRSALPTASADVVSAPITIGASAP